MKFAGEKEHWPLTYWCDEIAPQAECCPKCHADKTGRDLITVHPKSVNGLPDLGLGLHAHVCCWMYDYVRQLPRAWWLGKYGEKHGYSPEDIKRLQEAVTSQEWLKVSGELGSKYFKIRNPGYRGPSTTARRAPVSRGTCPKCGVGWNGSICGNCGHANL